MVSNVTSLTGNGLKDWLIQRVTSVYFAVYVIYVFALLILYPNFDYQQLHALFTCHVFQVATVIALLALSLHAWIGIWTVSTDYMKCTCLRISVQLLVFLLLLSQFVWGLMIVWGQ